jgi:hypothetical protein
VPPLPVAGINIQSTTAGSHLLVCDTARILLNRRFGGIYRFHYQVGKIREIRNLAVISMFHFLVTANVSSLLILSTFMMETVNSSEMSVIT